MRRLSEYGKSTNSLNSNFPPLVISPQVTDEKVRKSVESLYETFRAYRTKPENLNSKWFVETRLPERVQDVIQNIRVFLQNNENCQLLPMGISEKFVGELGNVVEPGAQPKTTDFKSALAHAVNYAKNIDFRELFINPRIVSREESGLANPKRNINQWKAGRTIDRIVIHHTVTSSEKSMKEIQEIAFGRRMSDVSYHFAIGPDGTIYEGRSLHYQGAHASGVDPKTGVPYNETSIGIVIIGNFEEYDSKNNPTGTFITEEKRERLLRSIDRDIANVSSDPSLTAEQKRSYVARLKENRNSIEHFPAAGPKDTLNEAQINAIASLIKTIHTKETGLNEILKSYGLKVDIKKIEGHNHTKATACPGVGCKGIPEALHEAWQRSGLSG